MAAVEATVPLFEGLEDIEAQALMQRGDTRSYARHTIIANEGDPADRLFVLLAGFANLYVSNPDGRKFVMATHGPGECIGESAIDGGLWPASVETIEPCRLWTIPRHEFLQVIEDHPQVSLRFIQVFSSRTRNLMACTKMLALKDVYGRVVNLINDLSVEQDGVRLVPRHLTQDEIATHIGASREMVNRIMRDLTTGGYFKTDHGHIIIVRQPPPHW